MRNTLPIINWQDLYKLLGDLTFGFGVYIETRHNGMISIASDEAKNKDIEAIALVITPATNGVDAWDTEEPTRVLVEKIQKKTGRNCLLLLSRDHTKFVDYYAYVQ